MHSVLLTEPLSCTKVPYIKQTPWHSPGTKFLFKKAFFKQVQTSEANIPAALGSRFDLAARQPLSEEDSAEVAAEADFIQRANTGASTHRSMPLSTGKQAATFGYREPIQHL